LSDCPAKYQEVLPTSATQQANSRARALAVTFKHAEAVIGSQGGPGWQARARHILDCAREKRLDPRLYEIAYFVNRTFKDDHVIINHVTNPVVIGENT
jgi:hypothetical protein